MTRERDLFSIRLGERIVTARIVDRFETGCLLDLDGRRRHAEIFEMTHGMRLYLDGLAHDFHRPDLLDGEEDEFVGDGRLTAPMPGLVKIVHVREGDSVAKGDALIVMEAMKMELTLTAAYDGIVDSLHVGEGDQTSESALLLSLRPEDIG